MSGWFRAGSLIEKGGGGAVGVRGRLQRGWPWVAAHSRTNNAGPRES